MPGGSQVEDKAILGAIREGQNSKAGARGSIQEITLGLLKEILENPDEIKSFVMYQISLFSVRTIAVRLSFFLPLFCSFKPFWFNCTKRVLVY